MALQLLGMCQMAISIENNPVERTDAINGQIRTAVGCTIPLLIKLLKDDPTVILL